MISSERIQKKRNHEKFSRHTDEFRSLPYRLQVFVLDERWHTDLRSWYGGRARVAHAQPVARDASTTQADLLSAALAPVLPASSPI